jgi:hypothetical protein
MQWCCAHWSATIIRTAREASDMPKNSDYDYESDLNPNYHEDKFEDYRVAHLTWARLNYEARALAAEAILVRVFLVMIVLFSLQFFIAGIVYKYAFGVFICICGILVTYFSLQIMRWTNNYESLLQDYKNIVPNIKIDAALSIENTMQISTYNAYRLRYTSIYSPFLFILIFFITLVHISID